MKFLQPLCSALLVFGTASAAFAQINSVRFYPREYNDIPGANLSIGVGLGPSHPITFTEQNVSASAGPFANRDVWRFSADSVTAYQIPDQYFTASFDLTLTGSPTSPRKEAGFLLNSANIGDIQFIVNTDNHEVVQFGGSSFYAFPSTYNSGQTIHLGLSYLVDPNTGANALQLQANGAFSPYLDLGPGHGNGSTSLGATTVGGYFQIQNDPNNPSNSGSAVFSNLAITIVPEPSVLAIFSLGVLGMMLRRRKQ